MLTTVQLAPNFPIVNLWFSGFLGRLLFLWYHDTSVLGQRPTCL